MQQYNAVQYNDAQYNSDDATLTNVDFHQYNRLTVNTQQYNARADFFVNSLADAMTLSELLVFLSGKVVTDSIGSAETRVQIPQSRRNDNIFLSETFRKEISNKGLSDTIRVDDWTILRQDQPDPWGD